MVDINQVPVSLPLGHEQIWTTYPAAPHISICKLLISSLSLFNGNQINV
jgi:hypothetical protein